VQAVVVVFAIGLLVVIAYCDVRTRRIPNELSIAIAILGLVRIALFDDAITAAHSVVAGAVTFGAALLLFWRGAIGGGDAKLVTATALLIGYHDMLSFLFLMSLCGGTLALVILVHDKFRPRLRFLRQAGMSLKTKTSERLVATASSTVPYGVAIAAAGIITLVFETSLTR
jgi:prepilin peptidase CpaA